MRRSLPVMKAPSEPISSAPTAPTSSGVPPRPAGQSPFLRRYPSPRGPVSSSRSAEFLPCHAVGCRIHSRRPPRSSHGDGPTASRSVAKTHHDVERSGRLVVDHAMIPYAVLCDALILRRDLTIGHPIDGQVELTLVAD